MKYKPLDKVKIKSLDWYNENKDENGTVLLENGDYLFCKSDAEWCGRIITIKEVCLNEYYRIAEDFGTYRWTDEMIEGLVEEETKPKNMGEVSDGYHTFNELYEYRMLYNAALFNEFAKQGLYDVHKSKKHSDGEYPFGDSNWFIVMAELPTGQISNHYEMKDWDKFQIPEKPLANKWDGHSPRDVTERLTSFTTPKKEYPKTFEECIHVLEGENRMSLEQMNTFRKLIDARNAYWKIAGDEMGLDKPWEPNDSDYITGRYCIFVHQGNIICSTPAEDCPLTFPTEEMRDSFYENFKKEIEICKELL